MSVSMRVMSAGAGYRYLLRSVAAGDGDRAASTSLTRYYAATGTPPGRWIGSSVAEFGAGQIGSGDRVTEEQLALLIGLGRDPVTGEGLGREYPVYRSTEKAARGGRRSVAGYDLTFSAPKSVSVLWGLADAGLQEQIVTAHHTAIADVIAFLEREIAATRTGVAAGDGAVAQVAVRGVAAAAFDHWDSRAGDPQLHTHVVISNKVQTVLDGRWRSLDGRPMHAAVTALSAYYDAMLADRLTGMLGLDWEMHLRGTNMHPHAEIVGVPRRLIDEFSSRTRDIDRMTERLIGEYIGNHGNAPSDAIKIRLRAQATLATRPEKEIRSLAAMASDWRRRAAGIVGPDPTAWMHTIAVGDALPLVRAWDVPTAVIEQIGAAVVAEVGRRRATWRRWNLWAETSRRTMHWRFATADDREQVVARIVAAAEGRSVLLTPPELVPSPPEFRRGDGTSVFRPRHAAVYSSTTILAAEERLLARADDMTAPRVRADIVEHVARRLHGGHRLTATQIDALDAVATSRRRVDVLIGPAGAGKTTAMHALRVAWEQQHGPNSVVGLAPSAAAAAVLANDLGIPCENTAMWLTQFDLGRAQFRHGQLVIVDEATLADTATLDRTTGIASEAGAKVLLVGDWAQLQSVGAGGAFSMLAQARPDVPELTEIHRFTHEWETVASLELRSGRAESIAAYARHDRLREGTTEEMLDAAYTAWMRDLEKGCGSVLVAESMDLVEALNTRARADRILRGATAATREAALAGGVRASTGDQVITRRNDRSLRTSTGVWVRNGDLWYVDDIRSDGSMVVRRGAGRRRRATVVLRREYVAEHVDLGYAVTAHRAQGLTVDTAHVLVSARTTRENLYVSMTRGRESNTAYAALDRPDEGHAAPPADGASARTVLHGVLRHTGADLSAHQIITVEQETWTSIAQLAAEYETLAAHAQRDRWTTMIRASGLSPGHAHEVIGSSAFGPLASALRRVEAGGRDPGRVLKAVVARRGLADAEDVAAVLHHRLRLASNRHHPARGMYIAGLIPAARGPMSYDYDTALRERAALIESRASALADEALRTGAPWLRALGAMPSEPTLRSRWLGAAATIAAYRDRYQIQSDLPCGGRVESVAQRADADRATRAMRSAKDAATVPAAVVELDHATPSVSGP